MPADAASTQAGMNVSPEARSAIKDAIDCLRPHVSEDPRIEGLVGRLNAIANPTDVSGDPGHAGSRLAKSLTDLYEASKGLSPMDRQQVQKAARDAELEYLYAVSPGAAAALEARERATVSKADGGEIARAAAAIRKAEPGLSEFEAMERALNADPDAAGRYLESVR